MKRFHWLGTPVYWLLLMTTGIARSDDSVERPNVLFIAIDDLNSCPEIMKGETSVRTPNIERLARKGMLFTNAHCAVPACNPSRMAVLTGMAATSTGVYVNRQDWRKFDDLMKIDTLPHQFKKHGYKTLGGGKLYHAHSLSKEGYSGFFDERPWDEYFPSKEQQMPEEILPPEVPTHGSKSFYGGRFDWAELDIEVDEMADAEVVSWAEKQLSTEHEKPLFLSVGIYRPHIPWYTPKEHFDRHPWEDVVLPEVVKNDLGDLPKAGQNMARRDWQKFLIEADQWKGFVRGYHASVSFADDMVGRLLSALENGPMAGNTIIVLWSDHGYHLGQKEHWEKFALWEQTTRVPLIVVAPGAFGRGQRCRRPASLLDIYPTLNELCGWESEHQLDGVSLVPLLKDPELETGRSVVTTHGFGNHAVRSDAWRYIRYKDGSEELYHQEKDPKNFKNLAMNAEYASVKQKLSKWLPKKQVDGPAFKATWDKSRKKPKK